MDLLRLRDRDEIGSTFVRVLERYASDLEANQGKLVLSGVGEHIYHQLQKTELIDQIGQENIYLATSILSDSTIKAYQDAQEWLTERMEDASILNNG